MDLQQGKEQFILEWGKLGSNWGINKTMAQVHALLLIANTPVCAEEIIKELEISSGNANMNLRALIEWGLVHKVSIDGHRKDFFSAEKDMMVIFKCVIAQRKKKELEPLLEVLSQISAVVPSCDESKEFTSVVNDVKMFAAKADSTLDGLINSKSNWLVGTFMKML